MKRTPLAALAFLMGSFGLMAHADSVTAEQRIEVAETETQPDGSVVVSYVPANRVVPGEQLRYTISFANGTEEAAEDIVLTMPVEPEVEYIEGSALRPGVTVLFSVDDGVSFMPRADLTVTDDTGVRAATTADITHVSWRLDEALAPGAEGEVSLLAVLK